ncbi:hypothetical protein [Flavobacterium sp.]|uniref:hypothetical protein n=1 Tax=Flavobacterium sp. TaxID=239 RepID=UPI0025C4B940|nr:hypothetical protein [Flavobacterium sp.]
MKSTFAQRQKPQVNNSFEDLNDESFTSMQWNPGTLKRAMPKEMPRIKKMKSR